jgi:hypothetical protein
MLKDGEKMLKEVKGMVRLNAITRDDDLWYVRCLSQKGEKDRHLGKRWRLIKQLRRQMYVKHLYESQEK